MASRVLARALHQLERVHCPAERAAKPRPKVTTFITLASSLLVFSHVFKGAVGEAFLGIIAASNKYQAANKDIIAAYGKFYNLLLTAGYDDWQSYVLDQVRAIGHTDQQLSQLPLPQALPITDIHHAPTPPMWQPGTQIAAATAQLHLLQPQRSSTCCSHSAAPPAYGRQAHHNCLLLPHPCLPCPNTCSPLCNYAAPPSQPYTMHTHTTWPPPPYTAATGTAGPRQRLCPRCSPRQRGAKRPHPQGSSL
jgi:hypothetical protein